MYSGDGSVEPGSYHTSYRILTSDVTVDSQVLDSRTIGIAKESDIACTGTLDADIADGMSIAIEDALETCALNANWLPALRWAIIIEPVTQINVSHQLEIYTIFTKVVAYLRQLISIENKVRVTLCSRPRPAELCESR